MTVMTEQKRRPSWNSDGVESVGHHQLSPSLTEVTHLRSREMTARMSQVASRMMAQDILEALPKYWLARGNTMAGAGCPEEAEACREHARFIQAYGSFWFDTIRDDVLTVMGEERIFTAKQSQEVRQGQALVAEAQAIVTALLGVSRHGDAA